MNDKREKARQAASALKQNARDKLRQIWWAIFLRGILALAVGVAALFWPQQTIGVLTKVLGIYFLIDGIAGFVGVVRSGNLGTHLVAPVVSLTAGLALLFWSDVSAKIFLVIIGVWAVLQGITVLMTWWNMQREDPERGVVGVVGGVFAAVGIVFIVWPETGIVAVSWLIAIGAFVVGGLLIFLAIQLRKVKVTVAALKQSE